MKLRNKKTGEIIETDHGFPISVPDGDLYGYKTYNELKRYNSLAELNEEWEDVPEEPKVGYIIDPMEEDCVSADDSGYAESDVERAKELGIWFETEEEAELAVKKLKALTRLVSKGFRFDYVSRYENLCGNGFEIPITAIMPPEQYTDKAVAEDLDICFGGEE